ncbi:MAG TPA: thioredoxin family protein [Gemmatimonadales bacterium]|nr:thioredoxin family protein [Gemmatimonadales bacterium]
MSPTTALPALDLRALWDLGISFEQFLAESAPAHLPLWQGVYRTAVVPAWSLRPSAPPTVRLLVLAEDWCGDAANTVPIVQKWAEANAVELRILRRDEHPEVMDRYLTNGSRSIPIVIVLDAEFREVGHWGPRPAELQAWVMAHKNTMEKDARYKEVRRWYAKDRGETTLKEALGAVAGRK